jgi:hypothetical protein
MEDKSKEEIRREVRQRYAGLAKGGCCSSGPSRQASCCSTLEDPIKKRTVDLGYSKEEITRVPEGANMGLGCGNPTAMASLKPGRRFWTLAAAEGLTAFWQHPLSGIQAK